MKEILKTIIAVGTIQILICSLKIIKLEPNKLKLTREINAEIILFSMPGLGEMGEEF